MIKLPSSKKVLIIDDSALVREMLTEIINGIEGFRVVGTAADPVIASQKILDLNPDILTLDVEMPKMDGLAFLEKIMKIRPLPVLMISSLAEKKSQLAITALELGAIDYIEKPKANLLESLGPLTDELKEKLQICASANLSAKKGGAPKQVAKKRVNLDIKTTDKIIAIGASTGGTTAIENVICSLPVTTPGIVIVQHMPAGFTKAFAERLNKTSEMFIKEAKHDDTVLPGQVLIAPGDKHMLLRRSGTRYYVILDESPAVNRHRPSVDVLFKSVSEYAGQNALGIILTGMGGDGAEGILEMHDAKAFTVAQSEKTCIVYGMPKVAIEKGGVDEIIDLDKISNFIIGHNWKSA